MKKTVHISAALANPDLEGTAVTYRYQGVDKDMSYVTLTNGMRYVLTALDQEMTASARHLALLILIGVLVAVAAAGYRRDCRIREQYHCHGRGGGR